MGRITLALDVWPQLVNASPSIVGDLRFRRALYTALDRRTMAETLEGGLVYVADGWITPTLPEYAEVAQSFVRYEYDPGRARQEIQALGYSPGPDGILRLSSCPVTANLTLVPPTSITRTFIARASR